MKFHTALFSSALVLAGALGAGSALAESPYASWQASDDDVRIADSFNRSRTDTDVDVDLQRSEDNSKRFAYERTSDDDSHWSQEISKSFTSSYESSDDDVTKISEDNDWTQTVSEDNDWTQTVSEDNDWTNTESTDLDFDLQLATPTMTSTKYQDQEAGHEAGASVYGAASGHTVGVEGGTNLVSAGNEETTFYGPALINENNNNFTPQSNDMLIGGDVGPGAYLGQSNAAEIVNGDKGDRGLFGSPIGNTSAQVGGNVGQQSGSVIDQQGDSSNGIREDMSSYIGR